MYVVDGLDTVLQLHEAPSPDVGAPLPVVLGDEHRLLLAYIVNDQEAGVFGELSFSPDYSSRHHCPPAARRLDLAPGGAAWAGVAPPTPSRVRVVPEGCAIGRGVNRAALRTRRRAAGAAASRGDAALPAWESGPEVPSGGGTRSIAPRRAPRLAPRRAPSAARVSRPARRPSARRVETAPDRDNCRPAARTRCATSTPN